MDFNPIKKISNFFYENADERIRDKFLFGSPFPIVIAYLCYVVIILKILPKFMKNWKPLDYNKYMTLVDCILCLRSIYFIINGFYPWFFIFNWSCQPVDQSGSWISNLELNMSYQFTVSLFVYTLQSVVFVISKRTSPVATYLLIHHSTFPLMVWIGANFYPGGHGTFIGFMNAIVHFTVTFMRIVEYFYPNRFLRDYRKTIDVCVHILQVIVGMIHSGQVLFLSNCDVPKRIACFEVVTGLFLTYIYNRYVINAGKIKIKA